jgi:hypothetical protein
MEKKENEAIYLEAAPLEWLSQPDNQLRLRQMLARNRDKLCGNSGECVSQMGVPSTEQHHGSRPKE